MKQLLRASIFAATFAATTLSSQAQVLTANTLSSGSFVAADAFNTGFELRDGQVASQTFTGADSLGTVTFRFITLDSATVSSTDLNVVFSTWAGSNAVPGGNVEGIVSVLDEVAWTTDGIYQYLDASVDLSALVGLTPATTYGISIAGNVLTDSANVRLAGGNTDFASGAGFFHNTSDITIGGTPLTALAGASDFSFAASGFSPVPEASSAAVLFAGLFVGGLMFRRRRHVGSLQAQA